MLTGTHWLVLYFRALGANIGKDCALFAGGAPSLMFTEPDLLTLGDRVCGRRCEFGRSHQHTREIRPQPFARW